MVDTATTTDGGNTTGITDGDDDGASSWWSDFTSFALEDSELYSLPAADNLVLHYLTKYPDNVTRGPDDVVTTIDHGDGEPEPEPDEDADTGGNSISNSTPTDKNQLLICHVISMLPFFSEPDDTDHHQSQQTQQGHAVATRLAYEKAAAIALALHHLNVGDTTIVEEIGQIVNDGNCNVMFTVEYMSTYLDPGRSIDEIFDIVGRKGEDNGRKRGLPCSFVGAVNSATTVPTAMLTSQRGLVQVSGSATSSQLDNKGEFSLFGRSIPSDQYNIIPLIQYLQRLNVQHVALITLNESYGNSFGQYFDLEVQKLNSTAGNSIEVRRIILTSSVDDGSIREGLRTLRHSQYRFVIAVMFDFEGYEKLMGNAYEMGLAGKESNFQWFFPDSFQASIGEYSFPIDSPLAHAYEGAGRFAEGAALYDASDKDRYTKFVNAMKDMRNGPDLSYLSIVMPDRPDSTQINETRIAESYLNKFNATVHKFQDDETKDPGLYGDDFLDPIRNDQTAYFYDATIMMGLAACKAAGANDGGPFTGEEQYQQMTNLRFTGVTGKVIVDPSTGSRLSNTTLYTMNNFVPRHNGTHVIFDSVLTDLYQQGQWNSVSPFMFSDGSTSVLPDLSPASINFHYISTTMRGLAWTFWGISVLTAIGFGGWTFVNRKMRVVKASQPFFLYMICLGIVVFASKIVPATFDHQTSSKSALDKSCNSVVWLFALGVSIILGALCAKTYRINRVMQSAKQFRRVKVTILDTLKPMGLLIGTNIIVLTAMQISSPIEYSIVVNRTDRFDRNVDVQGKCLYGAKPQIWYLLTLAFLAFATLVFSIWQAWRARNLSTEFQESKSIFMALILVSVTCFVSVPVLMIAQNSTNVVVFLRSALVLVICESLLLLIFVPKILYARDEKRRSRKIQITGLAPPERVGKGDQYTMDAAAAPSCSDETRDGYDDDNDGDGEQGERIVTRKTANNLAVEVRLLKAKVRRLEREVEQQQQLHEHGNMEHENLLTNEKDEDEDEIDSTYQTKLASPDVSFRENGSESENGVETND